MSDKKKLNPRQEEFVRQYFLCGRNASEAMRRAGYKSKNVDVDAAQLLVNPGIQKRINEIENETKAKFNISLEDIVNELRAIGFGHAGKVATWNEDGMTPISSKDMSEDGLKFVDSIEKITIGKDVAKLTVKTLARDKVKALELLAKLLGYDKNDGDSGNGELKSVLKQALKDLDSK